MRNDPEWHRAGKSRGVIMNLAEIIETQNTIIKLQADAIHELFGLLMQHMTAEEADNLPCVAKINLAATLRNDI